MIRSSSVVNVSASASRHVLRQTSLAASSLLTPSQSRRTFYTVPEMSNVDLNGKGIPGLYSAKGLDIVWKEYQTYASNELTKRINLLNGSTDESGSTSVSDTTGLESLSIIELVQLSKVSSKMDKGISFYSSQIFNNQFFLEGLFHRSHAISDPAATNILGSSTSTTSSTSNTQENIPIENSTQDASANTNNSSEDFPITRATRAELNRDIDISSEVLINPIPRSQASTSSFGHWNSLNQFSSSIHVSFGSEISFKEVLLAHAESIFGDGYTWLVFGGKTSNLFVFNTYGWGTPPMFKLMELTAASEQMKHISDGPDSYSAPLSLQENSITAGNSLPYLVPLLNINVWQHAYLHDYGVFGKRRYLENVWNTIDWSVVEARFDHASKLENPQGTSRY